MSLVMKQFKRIEINHLYSSRARIYDFLLGLTAHSKAIDYFIRNLPLDRNSEIRVLDAGCGTGTYTFAILKHFPNARVIAVDFNEKMIEVFKNNLDKRGWAKKVKVFAADIVQPLPEINEKFDVIITGGVLEYVNIEKAVRNLSSYLDFDGYFLNTTVKKNVFGELAGKIWGLTPYSRDKNIQPFRENKFTLLKLLYFPFTKEAHLFRKIC